MGAGSDSAQISTLNPWNMLYYMTTGFNVASNFVNSGQTEVLIAKSCTSLFIRAISSRNCAQKCETISFLG
jgi:hypothetical protein